MYFYVCLCGSVYGFKLVCSVCMCVLYAYMFVCVCVCVWVCVCVCGGVEVCVCGCVCKTVTESEREIQRRWEMVCQVDSECVCLNQRGRVPYSSVCVMQGCQ